MHNNQQEAERLIQDIKRLLTEMLQADPRSQEFQEPSFDANNKLGNLEALCGKDDPDVKRLRKQYSEIRQRAHNPSQPGDHNGRNADDPLRCEIKLDIERIQEKLGKLDPRVRGDLLQHLRMELNSTTGVLHQPEAQSGDIICSPLAVHKTQPIVDLWADKTTVPLGLSWIMLGWVALSVFQLPHAVFMQYLVLWCGAFPFVALLYWRCYAHQPEPESPTFQQPVAPQRRWILGLFAYGLLVSLLALGVAHIIIARNLPQATGYDPFIAFQISASIAGVLACVVGTIIARSSRR